MQALKESAGDYDEVTKAALISSIDSKVNAVIEEISTADEISVGNSMTTFRKYITFEIVDITKVPAEYLSVDTKAINQAIRNGVRDIPGLKIFEKLSTVMR